MDNKEYEKRYDGTAILLRIIGFVLLAIGLGCVVVGMTNFFISMNNWDEPNLFFLNFIGFPFLAAGGACLVTGFQKKMNSYIMSQNASVTKEYTNYMLNETSDTIAKTAGKVANEINANKGTTVEGVTANTCSKCGFANPAGAKFCSNCGAQITKKCPYCGAENDDGAKYCNTCGRILY